MAYVRRSEVVIFQPGEATLSDLGPSGVDRERVAVIGELDDVCLCG
jgi:hypothetical protein